MRTVIPFCLVWAACTSEASTSVVADPAPAAHRPPKALEMSWSPSSRGGVAILDLQRDWRREAPTLTARLAPAENGIVVNVEIDGVPDGSSLRSEDRSATATSLGSARLAVPIADLGAVERGALAQGPVRVQTSASIELAIPGYAPAPITLPDAALTLHQRDVDMMFQTRDFRMPSSADEATPLDTVVVLHGFKVTYLGPGTTLGDIDWIATATNERSDDVHHCSGYIGHSKPIAFGLEVTTVEIRDLRTGETLHEKVLRPDRRCPAVYASYGSPKLSVSREKIEKWVRSRLPKINGASSARRAR